jgi:hypothetical protein
MPGKDTQILPLLPVTVYGRVFNCCYSQLNKRGLIKMAGHRLPRGGSGRCRGRPDFLVVQDFLPGGQLLQFRS